MVNCLLDGGQLVIQNCSTLTTSIQFHGSVTSLKQISSSLQLTGIRTGQHVLRIRRDLQQPSIKQQVIVVLTDMPLPRQFESDLLVLNVVESAPQTLVSAVIYAFIKHHTDVTTAVQRHCRIDRQPQESNVLPSPTISMTMQLSILLRICSMQACVCVSWCRQSGSKSLDAMFGKARCVSQQKNFALALELMNQAVVMVSNFLPAITEKMKLQLAMYDWEQVVDTAHRYQTSAAIIKCLPYLITGCTVACCKGDQPFQWETPKFDPSYFPNPLIFSHQNLHRWLRLAYLLMCKVWWKSVYGGLPHE